MFDSASMDGLLERFTAGQAAPVSQTIPSGAALPRKLSDVEKLILNADCMATPGDEEARDTAREQVAIQLGCELEDIKEIVQAFGEEAWGIAVMEERVARATHAPMNKDQSWDRLEGVVLKKLLALVEGNKVTSVGELLAVAKTANAAHRTHDRKGGGGNMAANQTNVYIGGDPNNGVLPAGDLGRITLKLSHRSVKQIEGSVIRNPEDPKTLDQMKMLSIQEIQRIGDE